MSDRLTATRLQKELDEHPRYSGLTLKILVAQALVAILDTLVDIKHELEKARR